MSKGKRLVAAARPAHARTHAPRSRLVVGGPAARTHTAAATWRPSDRNAAAARPTPPPHHPVGVQLPSSFGTERSVTPRRRRRRQPFVAVAAPRRHGHQLSSMPSPANTPSAPPPRQRRRRRHHRRYDQPPPLPQLNPYDGRNLHRPSTTVVSLPADTTTLSPPQPTRSAAATTASCTASVVAAAMAIANETNIDLIMINKIKEHQVLYDTDEDQYKYIDKRDKAWKEVADELRMPGNYNVKQNIVVIRIPNIDSSSINVIR